MLQRGNAGRDALRRKRRLHPTFGGHTTPAWECRS
ncbi:hypothetical protein N028_00015 [Pseudomonas syringae USA011]|nr:hypothetical protein N028_00015 [Pseudomonas syringae USA011]